MRIPLAAIVLTIATWLGATAAEAPLPTFSPDALEFFEKQVRPVLVRRCHECHGGQLDEPKGGLRLDSRTAVLTGGDTGPAIVAGTPEKSLLIDAIHYRGDYHMPPKSKLPSEEIAALERWVKLGAPWPAEEAAVTAAKKKFDLAARKAEHWCWQPLLPRDHRPSSLEPPRTEALSRIDEYLLAKLQPAGLSLAPPADKRTLIRRATFDLLGLPPTPQEVADFLADTSPQAFERLVDRLLQSPHFGERWARHWLDLVRYAESRGHEFDHDIPNAFEYRDYVIRALNADLPYNQFVMEHVAGDLLPQPRLHPRDGYNESILGTAFWYLGEWGHAPVDIRKDETDRIDNSIDVLTKAFLGLTVSCARCHDHKFDAISQADYYALAGFLQSSEYRHVRFQTMQQERRVAEQLERLDAEHRPRIVRAASAAVRPALAELPEYLLAALEVLRTKRTAEQVAAERKLDAVRLARWTAYLQSVRDKPEDPLFAWSRLADDTSLDADNPSRIADILRQVARSPQFSDRGEASRNVDVVIDYANVRSGAPEWLPDSASFGSGPVRVGDVRLSDDPRRPIDRVFWYAAAVRDPRFSGLRPAPGVQLETFRWGTWSPAGRTIRTPTFVIATGWVYSLVAGGGTAYAAVDSHRANNGPLHGQLLANFRDDNGGRPRWIAHDLRAYLGHNAHVEFSAPETGEFAVLKVVQADRQPPDPLTTNRLLSELFARQIEQSATLATLAQGYAAVFTSALDDSNTRLAASLGERENVVNPTIARDADPTSQRDRAQLFHWLVTHLDLFPTAGVAAVAEPYVAARRKLVDQIPRQSRLAVAMWDGAGWDEQFLIRGNSNTPAAKVPRRFLEAIAGPSQPPIERGSGRLELARRMTDPANPLISRVIVNRVWHHLFGRGIVPTVDNFGVLGEKPTHPELLDYLAATFLDDGWSLKRLIKRVMLTRAYQMSSHPDPRGEQADPRNQLWHRREVRRLEGEAIRDSLLAVSGRLDRTMFGHSVPTHLTDFQTGRGRPASGPLDGHGRRSIYIAVRRNFLSPMMLAFDVPIPFSTVGRRSTTNVPAQALILLNSPLAVQQAETWARHVLSERGLSDNERISRMYETALARPPQPTELAAATQFLSAQARAAGTANENHHRAWADFAHALFNAKEFAFVP